MSGLGTSIFDQRLAELHVLLLPLTDSVDPSPDHGKVLAETLDWGKIQTSCIQIFSAFGNMLADKTSFPLNQRSSLAETIFNQLSQVLSSKPAVSSAAGYGTGLSAKDQRNIAKDKVQALYTRCFEPGEGSISRALEDPYSMDPISTPVLLKEARTPFVSVEHSSFLHFKEKGTGPAGTPIDAIHTNAAPIPDILLSKLLLVRDAFNLFQIYHVFPSLQPRPMTPRYATPIQNEYFAAAGTGAVPRPQDPTRSGGCCCSIL